MSSSSEGDYEFSRETIRVFISKLCEHLSNLYKKPPYIGTDVHDIIKKALKLHRVNDTPYQTLNLIHDRAYIKCRQILQIIHNSREIVKIEMSKVSIYSDNITSHSLLELLDYIYYTLRKQDSRQPPSPPTTTLTRSDNQDMQISEDHESNEASYRQLLGATLLHFNIENNLGLTMLNGDRIERAEV
jgi:hypothetical protein